MNIYALIPLTAVVAYVPLLITAVSSRPWQTRHKFFILFLIAAMSWSLTDIFLRSNLFPQYNLLLFKIILITFTWMVVQFYCFASSFFTSGQGRWLPFAYASLAIVITLVLLGYISEGVTADGDKLYLDYGRGIFFLAIPLLILAARATYVFGKRLRTLDNPVLRNQIMSILLAVFVLITFTLATLLPWGREYPISHFGSIIVASILSYAVIRHKLVDIRFILRRGLAWLSLAIIGGASYALLLTILHTVFRFDLDLTATFVATLLVILVTIFIYKLRGYLFITVGKAFQGQSYNYRQKLSDFAGKIHSLFSLKEQGGELLALITKAIGCKRAYLLFPDAGSQDFTTQFVEPDGEDNTLLNLRLGGQNPIVEYLRRERKPLTKDSLAMLPEFHGLGEQEREEIKSNKIELFVPLISRDRLIGILALDKKPSRRYSLEDLDLLEDVTNRAAVSMEKEYLRDRLREREEELSVVNRCNTIITSSLDIHRIYESFIGELKKIVEVSWSAITLIEQNDLCILALYSEIGAAWKVGERLPIKGTATQWVTTHKEPLVELDLIERQEFWPHKDLFKRGIKSIVHIPLNSKETVIGSFHIASLEPNAYDHDDLRLLQQIANQLTQAIENSRLYSQEKSARDDLERQSKERTEFIDALVHEVKTPLTAILASSELMAVKLSDKSSPLSEVAQNLDSSAHHLNRRVAELLDFAKIQGTQLVLNLQPVDVREVVKSVANQISTLLQSKGQHLSFELPVSLPYVKADSERVAQVLLNLLINAIKFSPANSNISLRIYTTDAFLTLEVVDSAPPINPKEAKLLFTPYYRSEEAKRTPGFGLGLSICKRLVELQRGKIWAHSQDEGNIFGFSLPQVASEKPKRKSSMQGDFKK